MKCFETEHCFRDDIVRELQERLNEFDGIVLGSPVYYSNPTGQILSFAQRLLYSKEGEMAGKAFKDFIVLKENILLIKVHKPKITNRCFKEVKSS